MSHHPPARGLARGIVSFAAALAFTAVAILSASAIAEAQSEPTLAKRTPKEWLSEYRAADPAGRKRLFEDAFGTTSGQLAPEIVPTLLAWLEDADPVVRVAACELLRITDDVEKLAVTAVTRRLADSDARVRVNAAVALLHTTNQAEPGIGVLRAAERDGDLPLRREALGFLGSWSRLDSTLVEVFLRDAKDPDDELRRVSLSTLGRSIAADPRAADALRDALGDPVERVRVTAAWHLNDAGVESDATNSVLLAAATSPSADVRLSVLYGLGAVAPLAARDFLPTLIAGLADPDADNRRTAAGSLSRLGQAGVDAPEARDGLIALLDDRDALTRAAAALALGHIGADAETVLPALVKHLADTDAQTRYMVNHSLQQAGPEIVRVLPELIAALASPDAELRSNVAGLISMAGAAAKPAAPALIARLSDPALNVRVWSAYALRAMGGEAMSALPEFVRLLASDPEPKVRVEAARAIAGLGPLAGTAAPALCAAARDPDSDVRVWSLFALGETKVRSDAVLATLRAAAKSDDSATLAEANKALEKLGETFDAAAIAAAPVRTEPPPPLITRFAYESSAFVLSTADAAAVVEITDSRRTRAGDVERFVAKYRFRFVATGQREATTGDGELRFAFHLAEPPDDPASRAQGDREPNLFEIRAGSFVLQWSPSTAEACEFLWRPEELRFESVRADLFEDVDLARFIRPAIERR
jgi:HEAT repeat protein